MLKRLLCCLMAVSLLMGTGCALAGQPREIYPLDYDTMPEPRSGQHNYLLACVDNWQGNAQNLGNTDGVLMVTMDVDAKRLLFTTFSREMLIKRPDGGIGRFTYIAKNYGPDALCRTVSTHFGQKVEKYIIFSMDNVQTIIDAMGETGWGVSLSALTTVAAMMTFLSLLRAYQTKLFCVHPELSIPARFRLNRGGPL